MKINDFHVPQHHHPKFQAIARNSMGLVTTITDHDYGNGFCLYGVPCLFVEVCYGSLHRHNKAFTPSEWIAALELCYVLNERLLTGERDFTEKSIKNNFGYYLIAGRTINSELREKAREVAVAKVRETGEVYRVWSNLLPDGIEYHVRHENEGLGHYPYHRAEIQHTVGPKSISC